MYAVNMWTQSHDYLYPVILVLQSLGYVTEKKLLFSSGVKVNN